MKSIGNLFLTQGIITFLYFAQSCNCQNGQPNPSLPAMPLGNGQANGNAPLTGNNLQFSSNSPVGNTINGWQPGNSVANMPMANKLPDGNVLAGNLLNSNGLLPDKNIQFANNYPAPDLPAPNIWQGGNTIANPLPNNMPVASNNLIPNSNILNGNHIPADNNMQFGNSFPNGNSLPISNVWQNGNLLPNGLTNKIPDANDLLVTNNLPGNPVLPNNNLAIGNNLPVPNNRNPGNILANTMPGGMPIAGNNIPSSNNILSGNGFLNGNNFLSGNSVQVGNNMPSWDGNAIPISNPFDVNNILSSNSLLNGNNILSGNSLQIAKNYPVANILPIASSMPATNIVATQQLPTNGFQLIDSSSLNRLIASSLQNSLNRLPETQHFVSNNIQMANNIPYNVIDTLNPVVNTRMPTLSADIPCQNMPVSCHFPGNLATNVVTNKDLALPVLQQTNFNYPVCRQCHLDNVAKYLAELPEIGEFLSNGKTVASQNVASSLNLGEFGALPMFNGYPIAGITETIIILD